MNEEWKPIKDYDGDYLISNFGNVKSFKRHKNGKLLKKRVDRHGYEDIILCKNGQTHHLVHRLVAIHFLENKENKEQVNHINGIKIDNHVNNLEWSTQSENIMHAYNTGLMKRNQKITTEKVKKNRGIVKKKHSGEKNPNSKLTKKDVQKIKKMLNEKKIKQKEIAKLFNVSENTICSIKNKRRWN